MESLSPIQEQIVKTDKEKVVVMSSAASGKTQTMISRLEYLLDNGVNPEEIVMITFTNLAAAEMKERLGNKADKVFINTIHSYAYYLLKSNGFDVTEYVEQEQFDEFFPMIEEHPEVIKHVQYLIVDEFQDSSEDQVHFMIDMIQPDNWMVVGDIRQSIYRWRKARPDLMLELMSRRNVYTFDMDENYRNGSNILQYAKRIINPLGSDYFDFSITMRDEKGTVLEMEYDLETLFQHVLRHLAEEGENYGDWFILSRTNAEAINIENYFMSKGIPCSSFKKGSLSYSALQEKMKENTVKVLTIHQSKGLEAKNVAVVGAQYYNEEERCISYVAATRARDLLIWCKPKKKKKARTFKWE